MRSAMVPVYNCRECPFIVEKRTPYASFAYDYTCRATPSQMEIATYVEYKNEFPNEIPEWCPFCLNRKED